MELHYFSPFLYTVSLRSILIVPYKISLGNPSNAYHSFAIKISYVLFAHACYISRPSHSFVLSHLNMQEIIAKFLMTYFPKQLSY
jgi:hypothetical protein